MAERLQAESPHVWDMLGHLLVSNPARDAHRAEYNRSSSSSQLPSTLGPGWDDEDEYWAQHDEAVSDGCEEHDIIREEEDGSRKTKLRKAAGDRQHALLRIHRVVIMSILMMNTNQRCNPVAAVIGIFCHSTSAPELVTEMLAHAGLSISTTATHDMVNSLSLKSHLKL
ncbi:hypothetical protein H0H81_000219 [Sphagnurus paluster]|uniref:Uncharacterized protein n=1 Tax=Sphagnurus paluster TaxID=117069 RepID=A0A9P7KH45_9AGAR|nr:hypothetical protein H0H81_000219 [Sphagnurus paluster]